MIRVATFVALIGVVVTLYGSYVINSFKVTLAGVSLSILALGIVAINIRDAWKGDK